MAAYAEQVLISTGRSDWKSNIEEDQYSVLVKQLRKFLGRGGKYSDPYHNVMITNSSFQPTSPDPQTQIDETKESGSIPASKPGSDTDVVPQTTPNASPASAFLLPSFQYIPSIPLDDSSVEAFLKGFVLPSRLHATHDALTRSQREILQRQPENQKQFVGARKVDEILVLICGHGGRDQRCGQLGPILQAEFEDKLERQNVQVIKDPPVMDAIEVETDVQGYQPAARVGQISHIGGHKFAGNVIIYIPPSFTSNPLAGKGIWYGRVEPQHVEGIVGKTLLDGKVIKDLFRGGVEHGGQVLRL